MSPSNFELDLLSKLKNLNPNIYPDLLQAMPDVATLNKIAPEKAKPYMQTYLLIRFSDKKEFLESHIKFLHNLIRLDKDLIKIAWAIQKFDFFLQECRINLNSNLQINYNNLQASLLEIVWPPKTLEKLKLSINNSTIPQKEFLGGLQFASSKIFIKPVKNIIASAGAFKLTKPSLLAAESMSGIQRYKQYEPYEKAFNFKSADREIRSVIKMDVQENDIFYIHVESDDILPLCIKLDNNLIPFKKDTERNECFATYNIKDFVNFDVLIKNLTFVLIYNSNFRVEFE